MHITQSELKLLLDYDPETGVFTWTKNDSLRPRCVKSGAVAGSDNGDGYLKIGVRGRVYKAHRLAWLYFYGEFPSKDLDHINRNKSDNRICNIRETDDSFNGQNRGLNSNNTSGFRGVYWHESTQKWQASIRVDGKAIHLGVFDLKEDAKKARISAEKFYHPFSPRINS